jgi:tetratricopeptide (TPR) repeat protein
VSLVLSYTVVSAIALVSACGDRETTVVRSAPARDDRARPRPTPPAPPVSAVTAAAAGQTPAVESQPLAAGAPAPEPPRTYGELIAAGKQLAKDVRPDEARVMFERAKDAKPKRVTPYIELARIHLTLDQPEAARGYAEDAVEISPSSSGAWNTLGRVELRQGQMDAAIASFERATLENPDNSYAWNNLGYALLRKKQHAEAAQALERATSGETVLPYMWNNLGLAYEHQGRLVEARAAYERAVEGGSTRAATHVARLAGVDALPTTASAGGPDAGIVEAAESLD